MALFSILFDSVEHRQEATSQPECFSDLNLDQVVEAITASRQEYNLKPLFWTPLRDAEVVCYRQEVFRDLERSDLLQAVHAFAEGMRTVRRYLTVAKELHFEYYQKGWFLEAVLVYGETVAALAQCLSDIPLTSRALRGFREYLTQYVRSEAFRFLVGEAQEVKRALERVRYCVIIEQGKFKVKRYEGETDYSLEVEKTFEKFKQANVDDYLVEVRPTGANHIEAQILEFVARLYPEPFALLDHFSARHTHFVDETVQAFDQEVQFYVAYLEFIADFRRKRLPFCYPEVTSTSKDTVVEDGFDLALAASLLASGKTPICNDFALNELERILVVTGPNQGGKTTFARMVGQIHYLASLGCPVPGRRARLFLPDQIFTHFEQEERVENLRGRLEDDLVRIHRALTRATPASLFILNEIFSSTTAQDALFLSRAIMARLLELDVLGVWVTFLDELAAFNERTVSMVACVDPQDPSVRTFKIVRRPADGLAYALSLARKHGLTYEQIKERLP